MFELWLTIGTILAIINHWAFQDEEPPETLTFMALFLVTLWPVFVVAMLYYALTDR